MTSQEGKRIDEIPRRLIIGASAYTVKLVENLIAERGRSGECNFLRQTIQIDRALMDSKQKEVLLHEVLEAINEEYDVSLEHHQLSLLSVTLMATLRENKALRECLLGEGEDINRR